MKNLHLKVSFFGFICAALTSAHAAVNTFPTITPGISVGLTGLYLQPNADNLNYATFTTPLPLPAPNWSQVVLKPSYKAAFDLSIQYNFLDPMNNANLDWLHLNTSDSDSFQTTASGSSVAPTYYFGPLAQALVGSSANSQAKFNVDNVNLTLGRLINLGDSIQLDPFAGIQGAYLKQDITSNYVGVDSSPFPYSITSYNTSKFTGIGPRLGINATYFITNRFGLTVKVAGGLLAGTLQTNTTFNSYGAGNTTPINTSLADISQHKVIPAIDSKIEASYIIPLKTDGANVTLAAGYLFATYLNGINQVVPTALVPGAFNGGAIAIETSQQNQSNLNLNGPYVSVVWKF